MNIPELYQYLRRARRDLWAVLESVPEEVLARPLLNGERFHCLKDLILHIAEVEDGWLNLDIQRGSAVQEAFPLIQNAQNSFAFANVALAVLLTYWRSVEERTLAYLATLNEQELKRVVALHDAPTERYVLEGLLWHVFLHEVRHTAQLCVLLRMQEIRPPALDLLFYLPTAPE